MLDLLSSEYFFQERTVENMLFSKKGRTSYRYQIPDPDQKGHMNIIMLAVRPHTVMQRNDKEKMNQYNIDIL